MTLSLVKAQLEEQMQQAVDAINAGQFTAAEAAYLECVSLTRIAAESANADKHPSGQKQITLDIP